MARPSDFSEDIADKICELIAEGKSLRKICLAEDFPDKSTVFRWLGHNTKFRDQYEKSREVQMDYMAEEIMDIADDGTNDYGFKDSEDSDGAGARPVFLAEHVQRSRLRIDSRKWLMSKLRPKKYGEFNRTELTGADGGPVLLSIADQIRQAHNEES
jgi:terminase small subunit-like protein